MRWRVVTGVEARTLSVVELQGALDAAWRGEFRPTDPPGGRSPKATSHGGRPQKRAVPDDRGAPPDHRSALGHVLSGLPANNPLAVVLPAHRGAGASTVALALGIALAKRDWRPHLIECSTPDQSGLAAATDTELGTSAAGWRFGTRGALTIHRPAAASVAGPPTLPEPPVTRTSNSPLIVDPAWSSTEVVMGTGWAGGLAATAQVVLVLRTSVPGVQAAERILTRLSGRSSLVVVLGPGRWPGVVTASCGPLLFEARTEARVVALPIDDHLAFTGLTADPLPKSLQAAARVLAELAFPEIATA